MELRSQYDMVIVGGGFFGCYLASFLRKFYKRILIIEKESDLLVKASYSNQARVHNGYHYPRSILTALRSRINFPTFTKDFASAIDNSFDKVYGTARNRTKVNAYQFRKFCDRIGAPIYDAPDRIKQLFNYDLVEEVFLVKEFAFDAVELRNIFYKAIEADKIDLKLSTEVMRVFKEGNVFIIETDKSELITSTRVINCTYSQINVLLHRSQLERLPLKQEVTEIALIKVPKELEKIGITIMDGPFFSTMPFPARKCHSLSHVSYTPHLSWSDLEIDRDPQEFMKKHPPSSFFRYMLCDAARYIPLLHEAKYLDSLFEIKTISLDNEVDDGRPIIYKPNYGLRGYSVIMGGKIDNIYDVTNVIEKDIVRGVF